MFWRAMLVLVPVSLALSLFGAVPRSVVFLSAILAIIPLAEWVRRATEQVAARAGSAIGGLMNVSFGNAPELILALFVLYNGHAGVVKAQITGSLIGNSLLGLGLAIVAGSFRREVQHFNRERAGHLSSLLILVTIAVLLPALFDYTERGVLRSPDTGALDQRLSLGVAIVLILVYVGNLVYTLVTHRDVFARESTSGDWEGEPSDLGIAEPWSLSRSLLTLAVATSLTAVEADIVSNTVEATAVHLGLTPFFLGVVVLAVVGNAAEYISAVYFARRGHMGLVVGITVGSTIQVGLLVAPLLVIFSYLMGKPMDLVFGNPIELIAIAGAAFIVNSIAQDGETTWFEGVLLLAVYLLFALAFFLVTE
ncbi:MAG TPA: calcium/proton exchanger [Gemmatimonadaceae bacterium]|nr:calcium/proton exchanger [Gemmatimonadaceae bacterium]